MSAWEFVGTVSASVVFSGGLTWLFREWISARLKESIRHEYETKRIQFEADLKREADASLERLRSELSIEAARRTVEHTRIHERRLEILSEVGGKLFKLQKAFVECTGPVPEPWDQDPDGVRKFLEKSIEQFQASLEPIRFFIPARTLEKLDAFRGQTWKRAEKLDRLAEAQVEESQPERVRERRREWLDARAELIKQSEDSLTDLHQDFQRILGIVDPPPSARSSCDGSMSEGG